MNTGWIVSKELGAGQWGSEFFTSLRKEENKSPVQSLVLIHSVRQNADGTYLIQGEAWDSGFLSRWPQDWLCGPGDDTVIAALRKMDSWLRQRYTGTYGRWT